MIIFCCRPTLAARIQSAKFILFFSFFSPVRFLFFNSFSRSSHVEKRRRLIESNSAAASTKSVPVDGNLSAGIRQTNKFAGPLAKFPSFLHRPVSYFFVEPELFLEDAFVSFEFILFRAEFSFFFEDIFLTFVQSIFYGFFGS